MSTTGKPRHLADEVPDAAPKVTGFVVGNHALGPEDGADQRNSDPEQADETSGEAAQG